MTDLTKMQRGDQFADVHPDEVENYSVGGWSLCEDQSSPLLDYFRESKLDEKPTIAELKEATGEKYSGSEITEAWHEYEAD